MCMQTLCDATRVRVHCKYKCGRSHILHASAHALFFAFDHSVQYNGTTFTLPTLPRSPFIGRIKFIFFICITFVCGVAASTRRRNPSLERSGCGSRHVTCSQVASEQRIYTFSFCVRKVCGGGEPMPVPLRSQRQNQPYRT